MIQPLQLGLNYNQHITKFTSLAKNSETFGILIGLLTWGIVTIVSESNNLLSSLNGYYDKIYKRNIIYFTISRCLFWLQQDSK